MKRIFYTNVKKQVLVKKFEVKRIFLSSLVKFDVFSVLIRRVFFNKFVLLYPRYSNKPSLRIRCLITNNTKSVRLIRPGLYFSRQVLLKKLSFGELFPFFRSSW